MAFFTVQPGFQTNMLAIDFSKFLQGEAITKTSRIFVVENEDVTVDFRGKGFKYAPDGLPKNGTLEGYAISKNGQTVGSLEGIDVPMKALVRTISTLSTNDDVRLLARMLSGNDSIVGAEKPDTILGGEGRDIITGGGGADDLLGGPGRDTYRYFSPLDSPVAGIDTIFDFDQSEHDRIDLSVLGALRFIGSAEFSGTGMEVRFFLESQNTFVAVDMNSDSVADIEIQLGGEMILQRGDFVL